MAKRNSFGIIFLNFIKNPLTVITIVSGLLAFLLAVVFLPSQLNFYFDQARDVFQAQSILNGDFIKLLGPGTDIEGVFSGAVWYYLLAVLYGIGGYNPYIVTLLLIILIFATLPACWYLTNKLFNNKLISSLTVILYAFSPLLQISSRWISNPLIGLMAMPFLLIFLWRFINGQKNRDAIIVGLLFGLLTQSNLGYFLFVFLLPIYFLILKLKIKISNIIFFLTGLGLGISTYIAAEIKFNGRGIINFLDYLSTHHSSGFLSLNYPITVINKTIQLLSVSVLPFSTIIIFLTIILMFIYIFSKYSLEKTFSTNKKPLIFLLIWLTNIPIYQLFQTGLSYSWFVLLPSLLPLVILTSFLIVSFITNKKLMAACITLIVMGQLLINFTWIADKKSIFFPQVDASYALETELVDYTYKNSNGQPFTINSITVPLYINTMWAYFYEFYGKNKYGYTPFWGGRNQEGNLGNLIPKKDSTKYRYLIIEPSVPERFIEEETIDENNKSEIIETKKFKSFTVEKRQSKHF